MSGIRVTEPVPAAYGVGRTFGYAVHMVNTHGAPLITFTFASEEVANEARELLVKVGISAEEITAHM